MIEHTPEPWVMGKVTGHTFDADRDRLICSTMGWHGKDGAVNRANQRRIIACVNACAGIPTEDLEECASFDDYVDRLEMLSNIAFPGIAGDES